MAEQAPVLGRASLPAAALARTAASTPPPALPAHEQMLYVFTGRVRALLIAYVAVVIPLAAAAWWAPQEPHAYLRAMIVTGALFAVPGLVVAIIAATRSPEKDRVARWIWTGGFAAGLLGSLQALQRIQPGLDPHMARMVAPGIATMLLLLVANTLILRSRSGERAAIVDMVDLAMATTAVAVPLTLAFGTSIVNSPVPWFTVSAALWVVIAGHGVGMALTIRNRTKPGHRAVVHVAIALGVAVMISATAHVVLGINDFALPAGPFMALSAASSSFFLLFFLYLPRNASPGLERLPLGEQVRRNSVIAVLVLVSVPVTAAIVWWRQDHSWVPATALGAGLALLSLSSIRHLLAARETTRLYAMVERSAQERGELLADVMAHADTDRHRAAAHLHRQAASLYTAMAAFTSSIDQAVEAGNPSSVSFAAERLRRDLGQRADGFRQLAEAVKPLTPSGEEASRLAAPIRAFLENLCGDGPRPELVIDVDPELTLDWTTEAIVLRIVQEATLNAWWHAGAKNVQITIAASSSAIEVEVVDDGTRETDPAPAVSTMQTIARFLGGDLVTTRNPEGGSRLIATIPFAMRVPDEPRSHLRLVDGR
jgi:signal transduction histidine kinase